MWSMKVQIVQRYKGGRRPKIWGGVIIDSSLVDLQIIVTDEITLSLPPACKKKQ